MVGSRPPWKIWNCKSAKSIDVRCDSSGFSTTFCGVYATPKYRRLRRSKLVWNTRPRWSRFQPYGASAMPGFIV